MLFVVLYNVDVLLIVKWKRQFYWQTPLSVHCTKSFQLIDTSRFVIIPGRNYYRCLDALIKFWRAKGVVEKGLSLNFFPETSCL